MKLRSPAKINLGLRIVGRRSDGYHLLESLFWPVSLCDEIEIESAEKNSIRMEWAADAPQPSALPSTDSNLISKLLLQVPELGNWNISVKKRIPIGGGLGGSSSNVGTVLKFFADSGILSIERAESLAFSLGADVPYFLNPQPTWVTGVGEKRKLVSVPSNFGELSFMLVFFEKPCLTKDVFSFYKKSGVSFSSSTEFPTALALSSFQDYLSKTGNDLEPGAVNSIPEIAEVLRYLRNLPVLYADLTGSGSTCYAVSRSPELWQNTSKDLQHLCRKYKCSFIEANTFDA